MHTVTYWKKPVLYEAWKLSFSSKLQFSLQNEEQHWELLLFTSTGTVAGVYVGMEYGAERIRGTRDWVILQYIAKCFLYSIYIYETMWLPIFIDHKTCFIHLRFCTWFKLYLSRSFLGYFPYERSSTSI